MTDVVERISVRIEGTRPLLMSSPQSLLTESEKRKGIVPEPEDEAKSRLYRDESGKIVVPAICVLATLRNAAKEYKVPGKGRKTFKDYIYSGLRITPEMIPLQVPDGQDPENSWKIDIRPVVVNKARVLRARPRFDEWALEFTVDIVDPIIRPADLRQILEAAGKYVGLLDFRPLFGLFKVTKFEVGSDSE